MPIIRPFGAMARDIHPKTIYGKGPFSKSQRGLILPGSVNFDLRLFTGKSLCLEIEKVVLSDSGETLFYKGF